MTKERRQMLIVVSIILVVSFALIIYTFYFSKPASFPNDKQLVEDINKAFPQVVAKVTQETFSLDERHLLVPFVSEEEDYWLSYWEWKHNKWKVLSVDTGKEPKLWRLDQHDPASYWFVWNFHPDNDVKTISYYLQNRRHYQVTDGVGHYTPQVQLKKNFSLTKNSYGAMKLPDEWQAYLNGIIQVNSQKRRTLFNEEFNPVSLMYFGWIPYDEGNEETSITEGSSVNSIYINHNVDIEFIQRLSEEHMDS